MSIIKTIKNYAKKIIGEENIEFISHAKNYMSAEFFTKAIGFISVPVFTRLMTPDEYGILAIFTSIISISSILMGLNFHGSIVRYYHEEENNFSEFISSNIIFLFVFNILLIYFINLFKIEIAEFIGVDLNVFIIAIIVSIFNIPIRIFLSYLQTSKQSGKYSIISVTKSLLMITISIIWVYLLTDKRYLGRMYGQLAVYGILFIVAIIYFIKLGKPKFKRKYVKYSLVYGIPLIPHALSHFILSYFDRIAINQITGSADTGLYSFAYNVGLIMSVVVMAMNKAWVPIFYENLKENNYKKINTMAIQYSKYIFLSAIILILFSKEIVMILADESYYRALDLVPIIILSYIFVFLYTLFGNYSFYRKKTGLISIATLLAGLINIGLNYWLIPEFGYIAAAYTTLVSYILLFLFHYFNAKFIVGGTVIKLNKILMDFSVVLFFAFLYLLLFNFISSFIILFTLKILISIISLYYFILKKVDNPSN
ncbi:Membrane protein involved in the export of O-antigen and teichoic acid [Halanaerobium congolense]|jgi:O-antigen/teichoic acid export membrane protein|uniref:Membrane protein involved in the export of O-antigen and teichoic acid n=1 Tax=Halanaerobium congolense TaxID=54121 RepID=A0A1H9ZRZ9_9FIRM|nr:oligosaccharide flippase family protein [Halanaerobium congolense]PTX16340.1 O-antigen/teichoic acid export membrane protein [Halanaerobium congolense]SDF15277.1 Membrane protein involved in the export of O-antigen and teichoic acid [Halanaerobium congolense]SES83956.1 Membrane protein involved in the export of O-antigen and teichoic acid [Halanaerobium congolense]SFP44760.1 Membrane protein involved in the export of O-antigen and teichoic acid [Halanaerobium congolense]